MKEPPLLYSPRHGWLITGERACKPGDAIRDRLLARLADAGYDVDPSESDEPEE